MKGVSPVGLNDDDDVLRLDTAKVATVLPPGYVFGRPSKYQEEFCGLLIEHMSRGFSFESFASRADCSSVTLHSWIKEHPDFLNAKQVGLEKCRSWWEAQGEKGLFHPNFKVAAWRMNMMNRFGWSEKVSTEVDDKRDLAKKFERMTDEELAAAAGMEVKDDEPSSGDK